MRLRTLLLTAGAIATAGALALVPTAQANNPNGGPIAQILVGPFAGNAPHAMTLTMKTAQVQMVVFGGPVIRNCTAGSGTGTTFSGVLGVAPLPGQEINALSLTCVGPFPNTTLTITSVCPLEIVYVDPNVHVNLLDVGVPGNAKFSAVDGTIHMTSRANPATHCLRGTVTNGCQFLIGSNAAVQFDEDVKLLNGQILQGLHLTGPGLVVKNPNAACMGSIPHNTPLTLTAELNEHHVDGAVDFQP